MPTPITDVRLPSGSQGFGYPPSPPITSSPNATQPNRVRGRQARTAANSRARARGRSSPGANARRANNLRNARAAQNPVTAPRPSTTGAPTAPVPRGIPPAGAGATGGAAATASIWTATPASAPIATAISVPVVAAGGLAIGNAVYEDIFNRPFGPSLGDYFRPLISRDGSRDPYLMPGPPVSNAGQAPGIGYGISYRLRSTVISNGQRLDIEPDEFGYASTYYGPIRLVITNNGGYRQYAARDANGSVVNLVNNIDALNIESIELVFRRMDGLPETGTVPGTPQPAPPSQPFRPPQPLPLSSPNPNPFPRPDAPPLAEPQPEPDTQPAPAPQPTPYPNSRPDDSPLPFPPLIPARAPSPVPTPTPTPSTPSSPGAPPPSSRQGNRCPCSSVVIGNVGQQLSPIAQAQQAISNSAAGQLASTGVILGRLQQMQAFAEKAWQNTKLDKLINLLTLVSVLHNAAMLSRNVGETIGELASNMLATVGVKDATGSQLDINELVGTSVRSFVQSVVGVEVYTDVSTAWKKANRIISSAANIVYTVRSLHDTSKDVMEWTAENTGKIGNALKRWGVVGERAYPWMSERVKAQDAYRRKFQRVTDGLESLEDTASSLSQVTSNAREIQEEYTELKQQKDAFTQLLSTTDPATVPTATPESAPIATAETTAAAGSQSADVAIADAQKGATP